MKFLFVTNGSECTAIKWLLNALSPKPNTYLTPRGLGSIIEEGTEGTWVSWWEKGSVVWVLESRTHRNCNHKIGRDCIHSWTVEELIEPTSPQTTMGLWWMLEERDQLSSWCSHWQVFHVLADSSHPCSSSHPNSVGHKAKTKMT